MPASCLPRANRASDSGIDTAAATSHGATGVRSIPLSMTEYLFPNMTSSFPRGERNDGAWLPPSVGDRDAASRTSTYLGSRTVLRTLQLLQTKLWLRSW